MSKTANDFQDYNKVADHLFISDRKTAENHSFVRKERIRHIMSISKDPNPKLKEFDHINYYYIHAFDRCCQDLLSIFCECYTFINHAVEKGMKFLSILKAFFKFSKKISIEQYSNRKD
jgi:hypothetical protein